MTRTDHRGGAQAVDWSVRLAGACVALVGVLNVALGLISLLTQQIMLPAGVTGGLIAAGVLTSAAGVLVWRGSRVAVLVTLTIFGMLLVVQLGDLATTAGTPLGDGAAGGLVPRLAVLALLVGSLALAAVRTRGMRRRRPATPAR